ncbi:hypothetical protein H7J87_04535 [Mycolicibacterium wolinskyi]|uniref:Peptidase C39-like domain-containing protein n=1 Tax=Mycolicibacterium wolinskyi TaxID=59750 RepID=A0A1X2FE03_9MYCO|nr:MULTISPECIES: hypothetical protein [Mycolicibacterium]MCV7284589.1 hypothetical protein [Mycolicibacterium wolinskyi]MCV7291974.1 hypothetical protein [Mycolicibacterium goodii]ORX16666.1 hypothetical protein AWC31_21870 [Mycolicibacterium wolinskyi]
MLDLRLGSRCEDEYTEMTDAWSELLALYLKQMAPRLASAVASVVLASVVVVGCGGPPADDAAHLAANAATPAGSVAAEPDPATPEEVAARPIYGDPSEASEHWAKQSFEDCGLMAVANVVGLMTGDFPTEDVVIDVAANTPSPTRSGPIYEPPDPGDDTTDNGTSSADQIRLLKHFGVDATATDDDISSSGGIATGLPALEQYLGAGRKVIVGVNAETIWGEDGDHTEDDHSVVVAAVDADQRIVYLSDSGTDDGAGEQVDLDTFESAWAPGGHDLIVTDAPA